MANSAEPALEVYTACFKRVFDNSDDGEEHLDRIGEESKLVYLLWCFDGEIHNGGFDQFFYNSLGNYSAEILAYLKQLNAANSARLLEKAMEWFPNCKPASDREKRCAQLEKFEDDEAYGDSLDALNTEYYQYEDNLEKLLHEYVKENSDAEIYA